MIFLLAMTSALGMYDVMVKSFQVKENAMGQQQGVRVGFDEIIADMQLAGLNHNPATPETSLAGGGFDTVTTGNDEIVAFVLSKPDGSSSGSLVFAADVAQVPRDGVVESITIPAVAVVQDGPPYTLYRVTLNNDIGTWGSSGFAVRTPLIENVKSLTFRYFDSKGAELTAPGGAETSASVATRSKIRRIQVDVVGLTRDPDLDFRDLSDTSPATRMYRKFGLTGEVTPRNLGRAGIRDLAQ